MVRLLALTAFCLAPFPVAASAAGQASPTMADRLVNDLRFQLKGHSDFWRIGVTTPTLKPVRKGDRIVVAFWARASGTDNNGPGRIGRVQLEATPVIRAIFDQPFDIGPEWKMYQLKGVVDQDYAPGQLNAALHIDAAKQVLDLGPVFVLDYGQPTP